MASTEDKAALCGEKHPNLPAVEDEHGREVTPEQSIEVYCGMRSGPNTIVPEGRTPQFDDDGNPTDDLVVPAREVHVHRGYDDAIPPNVYRWES